MNFLFNYSLFFGIALDLGPIAWIVTIVSGLAFIVMFGISSAKGDYKGIIDSTIGKKIDLKDNGNRKKIS